MPPPSASWTNASTSANRRIGASELRGTRQSRPWRSQSWSRTASSRWTGAGVTDAYRRDSGTRVEAGRRADPGRTCLVIGHRRRQRVVRLAEQHVLVAEPDEARLHEQLDVVVDVPAGNVEADRATLAAVAQEVLDEAEADVAGIEIADRVELDDGPLVARAVALGAEEARDVAVPVEHVHHVVRAERPQWAAGTG